MYLDQREFLNIHPSLESVLNKVKVQRASNSRIQNDLVPFDLQHTVLPKPQVTKSVLDDFSSNLYGNTHSLNPSSSSTTKAVSDARKDILLYLGADPDRYSVIFTANKAAAFKLVIESFQFQEQSTVGFIGLRADSATFLAKSLLHSLNISSQALSSSDLNSFFRSKRASHPANNSAEEQAQKFPFKNLLLLSSVHSDTGQPCDSSELLKHQSEFSTDTLLVVDLDNSVGTLPHGISDLIQPNPPSRPSPLTFASLPGFFIVSLSLLVDFPTQLCAVIAKDDVLKTIERRAFAGGTVTIALACERFHQERPLQSSRFEDGTIPFLDIITVKHALAQVRSEDSLSVDEDDEDDEGWVGESSLDSSQLSLPPRSALIHHLADFTRQKLLSLRHTNSQQLVRVMSVPYSPLLRFTLLNKFGKEISPATVVKEAAEHSIFLEYPSCSLLNATLDTVSIPHFSPSSFSSPSEGDSASLLTGCRNGIVARFGRKTVVSDSSALIRFVYSWKDRDSCN
ncbi:Molybdenum cofactor sulfurase [Blattamonas nauphoetae]|uniref:Molybdenum cofactor sulfurase n=1 Tax=Blattamonas nauphoetae TaxID=2049346 RepID=A0ABQ9YLQ2_9EUKA|nr:Molybdenum cofactor sulfurase [Blattamonas nauphoetae]